MDYIILRKMWKLSGPALLALGLLAPSLRVPPEQVGPWGTCRTQSLCQSSCSYLLIHLQFWKSQDASGKAVGEWTESPALEIKLRKGHHLSTLEDRDAHCMADASFHPPLCSEQLQHPVEILRHDHPQRLLLPSSRCPDYHSLG